MIMKILLLLFPVFLFVSLGTRNVDAAPAGGFFDLLTVVNERDVALNDTVEFPSLDVETMEVINDAVQIDALVIPQPPQEAPAQKTKKATPAPQPHAVDAAAFQDLSRYFYLGLKQHLVGQQVPLTLVATKLPSYAKPLTLFVKVKKVHFKAYQPDKKGYAFLPVTVEIEGEVRDKSNDDVLFRFSDTAETALPTENTQPQDVLNQAASLLMKDLALYLKTLF